MIIIVVLLVLAIAVWMAGGQRAWREVQMGNHLAKMASVFEAIEVTRRTLPVGAGGGFDSLPRNEQLAAHQILERGMADLRRFPRHEVTLALVKNIKIADGMGRVARVHGMARMLEMLVEEGIALDAETFAKSYA